MPSKPKLLPLGQPYGLQFRQGPAGPPGPQGIPGTGGAQIFETLNQTSTTSTTLVDTDLEASLPAGTYYLDGQLRWESAAGSESIEIGFSWDTLISQIWICGRIRNSSAGAGRYDSTTAQGSIVAGTAGVSSGNFNGHVELRGRFTANQPGVFKIQIAAESGSFAVSLEPFSHLIFHG